MWASAEKTTPQVVHVFVWISKEKEGYQNTTSQMYTTPTTSASYATPSEVCTQFQSCFKDLHSSERRQTKKKNKKNMVA